MASKLKNPDQYTRAANTRILEVNLRNRAKAANRTPEPSAMIPATVQAAIVPCQSDLTKAPIPPPEQGQDASTTEYSESTTNTGIRIIKRPPATSNTKAVDSSLFLNN